MRIFLLLQTTAFLFTSKEKQPAKKHTLRREIRELTSEEWQTYKKAFLNLKTHGLLNDLTSLHINLASYAHNSPLFLPWHRALLLHFEQLLRVVNNNETLSVPYWDWTKDAANPKDSIVFTNEYWGFSQCYEVEVPTKHCLKRAEEFSPFYNEVQLNRLLKKEYESFLDFSEEFELVPHGIVHFGIGGESGDMSEMWSVNDPVFWHHHSFCDLLWHKKQELGLRTDASVLEQILKPFGRSCREIDSLNNLGVFYENPKGRSGIGSKLTFHHQTTVNRKSKSVSNGSHPNSSKDDFRNKSKILSDNNPKGISKSGLRSKSKHISKGSSGGLSEQIPQKITGLITEGIAESGSGSKSKNTFKSSSGSLSEEILQDTTGHITEDVAKNGSSHSPGDISQSGSKIVLEFHKANENPSRNESETNRTKSQSQKLHTKQELQGKALKGADSILRPNLEIPLKGNNFPRKGNLNTTNNHKKSNHELNTGIKNREVNIMSFESKSFNDQFLPGKLSEAYCKKHGYNMKKVREVEEFMLTGEKKYGWFRKILGFFFCLSDD